MNIILLKQHNIDVSGRLVINETRQVNHIKSVLKAEIGDCLRLGVLGGRLGVGRIVLIDDNQVLLDEVVLNKTPPKKLPVTVMLALPRPKVLRRLVMDMTAIGVPHIILINSYRTDKSYWGSPMLARIDDFIVDGLEQGVDTVPPKITFAKRFKPFVQDELPSLMDEGRAVVFHPYDSEGFGEFCANQGMPTLITIGAEGGFIPYEIDLLRSVGVSAVGLGDRILRTESAVNAVLGRYLL
ncbi:16S rRNA (uracil(1498)-N(3))-methyltransferase [Moraxella haemolytica]|uniref:16S rRNA (uracil(1498)-N(3))-methyltransferase n=1 Tax=Moraxella TaxID=475 RepID=UPI0025437D60|nr:16S rRNA (uracil(1498)-N(3))-methyltransferase [Moraxella sp. ZY171148]WII94812.1 16S rRNA (uracil(1498)-N(3))-methyltransferase [Moraxella sp. ZY171148]